MYDFEIMRRAGEIAGAAWDDREVKGSLSDQLLAVANTPALGSDGDLTDDDRRKLRHLASECRRKRDDADYRYPEMED